MIRRTIIVSSSPNQAILPLLSVVNAPTTVNTCKARSCADADALLERSVDDDMLHDLRLHIVDEFCVPGFPRLSFNSLSHADD
jgi:hypothetical protein